MKDVMGWVAKFLAFCLGLVLLVLMASYTMSFVGRIFPGDDIKQFGSLAIFDGGALIWLLIFLTFAAGKAQKGVSLLSFIFCMVGSGVMVAAEVFTGGADLLNQPDLVTWIGRIATWALVVWTIVNLGMLYLFHIVDPDQMADMKKRTIQDNVKEKALDMAGDKVNLISAQVADQLSEQLYYQTLAELGITDRGLLGAGHQIIDGKFVKPKKQNGFFSRLMTRMTGGSSVPAEPAAPEPAPAEPAPAEPEPVNPTTRGK